MKVLTQNELELVRRMRSSGMTQEKVAQELMKNGYTSKGGGKLYAADVSKFLIDNGFRCKNFRKKKFIQRPVHAEISRENHSDSFFEIERQLTDLVLKSSWSDKKKRDLIAMIWQKI